MLKKKLFLTGLLLFATVTILGVPQVSQANDWAIVPATAAVSTSVAYCIGVAAPSDTGWLANDFVEVEWASGFNLTDLTISDTGAASEVTIYVGTADCTAGGADVRITEATATPANNRDRAVITGQKIKFILEDAIGASAPVSFKFEDKTDGNSNAVVTPGSAGNYLIIGRWGPNSTGIPDNVDADFVYVGEGNMVDITANVDPALSMTLSGTTCALGTFSSSNIQTCNYNVTFNTNATSGYIAYIRDDGNLRNATNDIDDAVGGSVAAGTEAYGVSTTKASTDITQIIDADDDENYDADDCTALDGGTGASASNLTDNDAFFTISNGSISSDVITLCHAASISGATPAGAYSNIVLITAVGNF